MLLSKDCWLQHFPMIHKRFMTYVIEIYVLIFFKLWVDSFLQSYIHLVVDSIFRLQYSLDIEGDTLKCVRCFCLHKVFFIRILGDYILGFEYLVCISMSTARKSSLNAFLSWMVLSLSNLLISLNAYFMGGERNM